MTAPSARPWAIAHRGARDEEPENTLAAFERALCYPVDGIELDVQMSRDDRIVIHHDATLLRLTGRRQRVSQLDFAQLQDLVDGGADSASARHALPPLEQVLRRIGGRTRLLIEIKTFAYDRRHARTARLTQQVLALLEAHRPRLDPEQIWILSFDPEVLAVARQSAAHWPRVLNLSEQEPGMGAGMSIGRQGGVLDGLWAVDGRIDRMSAQLVAWARDRGLRVLTYTCNRPRQLDKALGLAVDGVLSDRPGWLTGYLNNLPSGVIDDSRLQHAQPRPL